MICRGNQKIIKKIEIFVKKYRQKAKAEKWDFDDDIKCYRMIYVIAELYPLDENYKRELPKDATICLKELWYLYYYFKHNIGGKKIKYSSIVNKYC